VNTNAFVFAYRMAHVTFGTGHLSFFIEGEFEDRRAIVDPARRIGQDVAGQ